MPLAKLISALGERLGVPDLALQENGTACIQIPDQFMVSIEQLDDADQCLVYAFIERVPSVSQAAVHSQLLQANLFGVETSDATLSIDPTTNRVVVHRKLSLGDMSVDNFVDAWLSLVGVASQWSQRLSGNHVDVETEGAQASAGATLGQWLSV